MKKKLVAMLIWMVVFAMLFSTFAYGAQSPDLSRENSLYLRYSYEEEAVVGADFALYRAGELSEDLRLTLSGSFADYPVEINGLTDEQFQQAADTLAGYAIADDLEPMAVLTTDYRGRAEIHGLASGLYLLAAFEHTVDGGTYDTDHQLLILPHRTGSGDGWAYQLTVKPKAAYSAPTVQPIDLQVVKVWDDKDSGGYYRPNSVTVHLLRDGAVYDTVVLEEKNSWRHEWKNLDHTCSWSVREEVPANYTVVITLEGTRFIVTNTCKTPPPPTPTPVTPTPPPSIPQTGQLWWPVPVLALLGVTLLAMGLMWRKDDEA